ncbi:hypothetical protein HKD37_10G029826 [Glycine soja]
MGGKGGSSDGGSGGGNAKSGGGGNSSKGGGSGGGSGGYMKAPGGDGSYISRGTFENNPQGYFSGLHGADKGNKKVIELKLSMSILEEQKADAKRTDEKDKTNCTATACQTYNFSRIGSRLSPS